MASVCLSQREVYIILPFSQRRAQDTDIKLSEVSTRESRHTVTMMMMALLGK